MINILFAARPERWPAYETPLKSAIADAGVVAHISPDIAPQDVDYIVYAPNSDLKDFTPFTRAKAVMNLWAGVEGIVGNETLKIPLTRMVDPGLTQGMVEWVLGHAMRFHLGMDAHIHASPGTWDPVPPPLTWDRRVTVLGLGELGAACATQLAQVGFNVTGWSRSQKDIEGITCLSGADGLTQALERADICVLLLPDTAATSNTLNAQTLAIMPKNACIINPGRGPLIDDDALLQALETGHIGHAVLDVFRQEPLPKDHPYWTQQNVLVTPHIASETRPKYSALTIAENISRCERSDPLLHVVDRTLGY